MELVLTDDILERRRKMNNVQRDNLKRILDIIKKAKVPVPGNLEGRSLTPEEAYIATWIAYAESSFRPDIGGTSVTESGLYQYINVRWRENFDRYS
jgi:hypothetical protein